MKAKNRITAICISVFLFFNCHLSFVNCFGQTPSYTWAKSAGGTGVDDDFSCSVDASGNIIATGTFSNSSITFGTTVLTNAGGMDMFIVKYDPNGNVLWATSAGGTFDDRGTSSYTDANGDIIATGGFSSSSITFGTTVLNNAGNFDIFIVKYDPNGNVLWAKSTGGAGGEISWNCSIDSVGNIIATGEFGSSSITFGTTVLTNAGSFTTDIFIVKYDHNGNVLWARSAGGTESDNGMSCSTDANGNIVVTGTFYSFYITFGTTVLTNSAGFGDMYIVKYDPNGIELWARGAGGSNNEFGKSCTTDANGNIIVTGTFYSFYIRFGTIVLTVWAGSDIFIVKYDPNGNVIWAKREGGTGNDEGQSCATDAGGNIITTGYFKGAPITFGTTVLTNVGNRDMFIVKHDPNGNALWATSAGGIGNEWGLSCTTDGNGDIIATGKFESPSITFGTTVLTNAGNSDLFIVKLSEGITDIKETNFLNFLSVYPNPSSGKFQISNNQFPIKSVEIYNTLGEIVYQNNIKQQTPCEINFTNQPKGVYFIKIHIEEKYYIRKIIIE